MKIEYSADGKNAIYDGYKFRKDPKTGYFLSSKKTDAGKRERLHNYVWRKEKGSIPEGYHIHHIDQNKNNNDISNLQALSSHEHEVLHGELKTPEERKKLRENLLRNAMPKAAEWHSSEDGKQWHQKHSKEMWENRHAREYKCTNFGKTFSSINIYSTHENRFCGNNCKSAYRRKSGVDNVERKCESCGKIFTANKYTKTKYCEECRSHKYRKNRE